MGILAVRPAPIVITLEEIIFNNSFYLSDFVLIGNLKLLYYLILATCLAMLIIISSDPRISVLINSLILSFFTTLAPLLIYITPFDSLIHISRSTNLSIIYSLSLYLSQTGSVRRIDISDLIIFKNSSLIYMGLYIELNTASISVPFYLRLTLSVAII